MHKNLRNSNKIHSVILDIFHRNNIEFKEDCEIKSENHLPVLERTKIKDLIENKIKSIGGILPYKENIIRQRLMSYIKSNRVAMRYEQACYRHIKNFSIDVFLICEICGDKKIILNWEYCEICGVYNKYRF